MSNIVVFDGPDGSGKTTVARRFAEANEGSIYLQHPGSTPLGKVIRRILKSPNSFPELNSLDPIDDELIQMLMSVDQTAFCKKYYVNNDRLVIADRINFISGLAYGSANDIPLDRLEKILLSALIPEPTIVFILSADDDILDDRISDRQEQLGDRYDQADITFRKKMRAMYREDMWRNPYRSIIEKAVDMSCIYPIDTSHKSIDEVLEITITTYKQITDAV